MDLGIIGNIVGALAGLDPTNIGGSLADVAEGQATLVGMEHCCNAIRDEDQYQEFRDRIEAEFGESAIAFLTTLGDIAKDLRI